MPVAAGHVEVRRGESVLVIGSDLLWVSRSRSRVAIVGRAMKVAGLARRRLKGGGRAALPMAHVSVTAATTRPSPTAPAMNRAGAHQTRLRSTRATIAPGDEAHLTLERPRRRTPVERDQLAPGRLPGEHAAVEDVDVVEARPRAAGPRRCPARRPDSQTSTTGPRPAAVSSWRCSARSGSGTL